jgi:hypothetical protein
MRAALARVPRVIPINGLLVRLGSSLLKFLLSFTLSWCLAIKISDEGLVMLRSAPLFKMLGVAMPLSNRFSFLMDILLWSIVQNNLAAGHLVAVLPPVSTCELYESAVKCHLAMRAVWAACPRSSSNVTIWLDFYYDIWVCFCVLVCTIVLMMRTVYARANSFLGGRVCT